MFAHIKKEITSVINENGSMRRFIVIILPYTELIV